MTNANPVPHRVDLHVGQRLRQRRKTLGVSQTKLADDMGLTFQQIQKYERGFNRISASRLWEAADVLGVDPAWFFEGLRAGDVAASKRRTEVETVLMPWSRELSGLVDHIAALPEGARRAAIDACAAVARGMRKAIARPGPAEDLAAEADDLPPGLRPSLNA